MLQLTSYNRMLRYLSSTVGSPLDDSKPQRQMLTNWILTASKQIEKYLGRQLKIEARSEYFDTLTEKDSVFSVKAYPIITLTDVYLDSDGDFSGNESEITDCHTGKNDDTVILPLQPAALGYKTIRVRYTGGLAYSGVRSLFTIDTVVGAWAVGKFVAGATSEAVGIVKAITATTMTVEILYGIFEAGEALTQHDTEELGTSSITAVLSVVTQQSLAETHPDIVRAAEIQVRYYWKHKDDFELSSTSKDSTNQRRSSPRDRTLLQDEAVALLNFYQNKKL